MNSPLLAPLYYSGALGVARVWSPIHSNPSAWTLLWLFLTVNSSPQSTHPSQLVASSVEKWCCGATSISDGFFLTGSGCNLRKMHLLISNHVDVSAVPANCGQESAGGQRKSQWTAIGMQRNAGTPCPESSLGSLHQPLLSRLQMLQEMYQTRSLGVPTSSWRTLMPLDFIFHAHRPLKLSSSMMRSRTDGQTNVF